MPSHVVREVLGMLDLEESMLDSGAEAREEIVATGDGQGGTCDELAAQPSVSPRPSPRPPSRTGPSSRSRRSCSSRPFTVRC